MNRRKKNSRKIRKSRKTRNLRRKTTKKGGNSALKKVRILIKPSALKSHLVSTVTVNNSNYDVDEALAGIVKGRIKEPEPAPYYFKEIKVKTQ